MLGILYVTLVRLWVLINLKAQHRSALGAFAGAPHFGNAGLFFCVYKLIYATAGLRNQDTVAHLAAGHTVAGLAEFNPCRVVFQECIYPGFVDKGGEVRGLRTLEMRGCSLV
jgi:hypothetical protein